MPDGTLTALVILLLTALVLVIGVLLNLLADAHQRIAALEAGPAPATRFDWAAPAIIELAEPEPLAPPFLRWPSVEPVGAGFNRKLAALWPDPPPARFIRQAQTPRPDATVPFTKSVAAAYDAFTHGRATTEMPAIA